MVFRVGPFPQQSESLPRYIRSHFEEIEREFNDRSLIVYGRTLVTGEVEVDVGTPIYAVVASLESVPVADRCFVRALPLGVGTSNLMTLQVYNNSFGLSTTAARVDWIVIGETAL